MRKNFNFGPGFENTPPIYLKQDFRFFPDDIELINNYIGVKKENHTVFYFNGAMPVFQYAENDGAGFRLFTTQLVA